MTTTRRKRIQRHFDKIGYEDKEFEGKSDEQIEDEAQAHMDMIIAPINEAYRRGEISPYEAIRRIRHESIKLLQEEIKDMEEDIWYLLHFGISDSKNPKVVERQRLVMEKRRREDPVIQNLQREIEKWKKEIEKQEEELCKHPHD
jgi:hypothetical protein